MRARAYVFCLCLVLALPTITKGQVTDQSDLFANAKLQLIDRIDCVQPTDQLNHYQTFPSPDGSRVERILGQPCRILPSMSGSASYLSYRLATGKGLVAGAPYLLEIEYPEDAPRSMVVLNAGCESSRGFHTGATSGDAVSRSM